MTDDAESRMGRLDHPFPPLAAQRPKALDKKIAFHRQLPDLGVQLLDPGLLVDLVTACLTREYVHHPLGCLALPLRDHGGMDAEPGGQLRQRRLLRQSFFHLTRLSEFQGPSLYAGYPYRLRLNSLLLYCLSYNQQDPR
jgi:hypothetical protein